MSQKLCKNKCVVDDEAIKYCGNQFLKTFETADGIISQSNKEFWQINKRKENKQTFSLKVIVPSGNKLSEPAFPQKL